MAFTDLGLWGRKLSKAFTPIGQTAQLATSMVMSGNPLIFALQRMPDMHLPLLSDIQKRLKEITPERAWQRYIESTKDPEVRALLSPEGWRAFTAHDWEDYKKAVEEASQAYVERAKRGEHLKNAIGGLLSPSYVIPTTAASMVAAGAVEPTVAAGAALDMAKYGTVYSGLSAAGRTAQWLLDPNVREQNPDLGEYAAKNWERDFIIGAYTGLLAKGADALVRSHFVVPTGQVNTLGRAVRGATFFGGSEAAQELISEGRVRPLNVAAWAAGGAALDALVIPFLGKVWQKRPHFGLYRSPEEGSRQVIASVWMDGGKGAPKPVFNVEIKPTTLGKIRVSLPRIRLGEPSGFRYTGKPVKLSLEGLDPMATKLYRDFLNTIPDSKAIKTTAGKAVRAKDVKFVFNKLLDAVDDVYRLQAPELSKPKIELDDLIKQHSKIYNALKEQYGDDVANAWKNVMLKHVDKGGLTRYWFGSHVQTQQMAPEVERQFGDFDVLMSGFVGKSRSKQLYKDLVKALGKDKVRMVDDLIEVRLGNNWVHLWNPHYGSIADYFKLGTSKYLAAGKEPLEAVKAQVGKDQSRYIMDLREQFLRKVSSLLSMTDDVFGTEPHRIKDAGDAVAILKYIANSIKGRNPKLAEKLMNVALSVERKLMDMGFIKGSIKPAISSAISSAYKQVSQSAATAIAGFVKGLTETEQPTRESEPPNPSYPKIYAPKLIDPFAKPSEYKGNEEPSEPPSRPSKPSDYGSDYTSEYGGSEGSDYEPSDYEGSDYDSGYSPSKYSYPKYSIYSPYIPPIAPPAPPVLPVGIPFIRIGMPKGRKTTSEHIKTRWVSEVDML